MKLCSLIPINDLEIAKDREYNMLLVHLCKNPIYLNWAKSLKGYKIMDNSIIELGESFSLEELIKYALQCEADEIILPDAFRDCKNTIKLVRESVNQYKSLKLEKPLKLMAVCHGNNIEEFKECFEQLSQIKEISTIGIPKVVTTWCGDRSNLFEVYSNTNKEIHLLGCWKSFNELKSFTKEMKDKIRTIDTCLPALLSLESDDPFKERNLNRTINFEEDSINKDNYMKIISEIDKLVE